MTPPTVNVSNAGTSSAAGSAPAADHFAPKALASGVTIGIFGYMAYDYPEQDDIDVSLSEWVKHLYDHDYLPMWERR